MKLLIFFISLLIANINAKLTCEEHFSVSLCNECQKEVWDFRKDPSGCGFLNNLFAQVDHNLLLNYDLVSYSQVIKNACSKIHFSCSYEEGKKTWQRVEKKCANELSTYLDWSANPSVLDHTVFASYATVLSYFFAIPEHNSICHKSGELCGIESVKPLVNWLKQEIPEGNIQISYDHQYVYKKDGTRIQIPIELVFGCGECGKNMIKEIKTWIDTFTVPDVILKVFDNSTEALQRYFSCPLIL